MAFPLSRTYSCNFLLKKPFNLLKHSPGRNHTPHRLQPLCNINSTDFILLLTRWPTSTLLILNFLSHKPSSTCSHRFEIFRSTSSINYYVALAMRIPSPFPKTLIMITLHLFLKRLFTSASSCFWSCTSISNFSTSYVVVQTIILITHHPFLILFFNLTLHVCLIFSKDFRSRYHYHFAALLRNSL